MATRPQWIVDTLASAKLSRRECVGLLINRDPYEPLDDREWFATTDCAWQRASRILERAIEAGEFATAYWTHAKTDPRDDSDFRVSLDECVRWALAHRDLFPDCPLTSADLPAPPVPALPPEQPRLARSAIEPSESRRGVGIPPALSSQGIVERAMATAQDWRDLRAEFEKLKSQNGTRTTGTSHAALGAST